MAARRYAGQLRGIMNRVIERQVRLFMHRPGSSLIMGRMTIAAILVGAFLLFGLLCVLIGWIVAGYMQWLVARPRAADEQQPRRSSTPGLW